LGASVREIPRRPGAQGAAFWLNGASPRPHNQHRGFILMNAPHRVRCATDGAPILALR